jgi:hypothetical protein
MAASAFTSRPKQKGDWWFRLTAPQEPANATFAQREAVRQGKLASLTIVFISIYTMLPLPSALLQGSPGFLVVLVITLLINAFALFVLNRKGHLIAAGLIIMSVLDAGFALTFLTLPHGLSTAFLPAFDLMAAALMVVVAFFPPVSVFLVMGINVLFIILWLYFGPHTADLAHLLQTTPYAVIYPPIGLHLFEAALAFFWVTSAKNAIVNLDRTEEIVMLERREIEQQEQQITLKMQLEEGIQLIQQTHVQVANGNFSARAPLTKENVLWQIAYSLNNLLARLERYSQLQKEMGRTQEAANVLVEAVRRSKMTKQPLQLPARTGTVLDALIVELTTSNTYTDHVKEGSPSSRPYQGQAQGQARSQNTTFDDVREVTGSIVNRPNSPGFKLGSNDF